jgi:DNA-binding MarR family transcriptional regulator
MEETFSLTEEGHALLDEVDAQERMLGRKLTDEEAEVLLARFERTLALLDAVLA